MKPETRGTSKSISIFARALLGLLLSTTAAQYARAQCDGPPVSVPVREGDRLVDTGINVSRGELLNFSAAGNIWAGVVLTGTNGPEGWADLRTAGTEFPLPGARIYSLLGQIGNDPPFYIGQGSQLAAPSSGRLFLRTNDNVPGNGSGQFTCTVRVSRRPGASTEDRTFSVPKSSRSVPTGITVNDGDRITFEASSRIWSGVIFTGETGPEGWVELADNPNFPLVGARRFSLLGRVGGARPFYVGQNNEIRHSGAPGQLSLLINDDVPSNGSGQFVCRVRVQRASAPLNASFAGEATLTIANKNTPDPFTQTLKAVPIVFSGDRCTVGLVNLPAIVRTFTVAGITNTSTFTRQSGGTGSFDRNTGRVDIPLTLRLTNSHPFGGNSDLSLTLSTAAPGGRPLSGGSFTLVGSGSFVGGFLNGSTATLVVTGTVSPTP